MTAVALAQVALALQFIVFGIGVRLLFLSRELRRRQNALQVAQNAVTRSLALRVSRLEEEQSAVRRVSGPAPAQAEAAAARLEGSC